LKFILCTLSGALPLARVSRSFTDDGADYQVFYGAKKISFQNGFKRFAKNSDNIFIDLTANQTLTFNAASLMLFSLLS